MGDRDLPDALQDARSQGGVAQEEVIPSEKGKREGNVFPFVNTPRRRSRMPPHSQDDVPVANLLPNCLA